MAIICHRLIHTLKEYDELPDGSVVFLYDLKHQAPMLYKEAEEQRWTIYGGTAKRTTDKSKWIRFFITGMRNPNFLSIDLYNGVRIIDYDNFDKAPDNITEEEMAQVAALIDTHYRVKGKIPKSGIDIIGDKVHPMYSTIPTKPMYPEELDSYDMLKLGFHGGANNVLIRHADYETHVDYHQIYAYVMTHNKFPYMMPHWVQGFVKKEFAFYTIGSGWARLKPDGFALLKSMKDNYMAGSDGQWFDLTEELPNLTTPDYEMLLENFEVKDLEIVATLYYDKSFDGKKAFGSVADEFYKGRLEATANHQASVKRFYKKMNEILAGYFERTTYEGKFWSNLHQPLTERLSLKGVVQDMKNPIVGAFITAYARQLLNKLLHMFPHDKVIGYDTDCVFFAGKPEEVPAEVQALYGDLPGQLHLDGIYENATHSASKHYHAYDVEKGEVVRKWSGVSKTGKTYRWNRNTCLYDLMENKDEK